MYLWNRGLSVDGSAYPSPVTDVLLSRYSLPAVFAFLVDSVISACQRVYAGDFTFDRNRRELNLAHRLRTRLRGLVPLVAAADEGSARTLTEFLDQSIGWFFGEARLILPAENEVRITKSTEVYKDAWDETSWRWDAIKKWLLNDSVILYEYHELTISDERWPLLGFTSEEEASEFLEPTTRTLFDRMGSFEHEFLRELAKEGEVDIEEFVARGTPRGIIVDVFNRLARDQWAFLENGRIRGTALSRKFIAKQLDMGFDPPDTSL